MPAAAAAAGGPFRIRRRCVCARRRRTPARLGARSTRVPVAVPGPEAATRRRTVPVGAWIFGDRLWRIRWWGSAEWKANWWNAPCQHWSGRRHISSGAGRISSRGRAGCRSCQEQKISEAVDKPGRYRDRGEGLGLFLCGHSWWMVWSGIYVTRTEPLHFRRTFVFFYSMLYAWIWKSGSRSYGRNCQKRVPCK